MHGHPSLVPELPDESIQTHLLIRVHGSDEIAVSPLVELNRELQRPTVRASLNLDVGSAHRDDYDGRGVVWRDSDDFVATRDERIELDLRLLDLVAQVAKLVVQIVVFIFLDRRVA